MSSDEEQFSSGSSDGPDHVHVADNQVADHPWVQQIPGGGAVGSPLQKFLRMRIGQMSYVDWALIEEIGDMDRAQRIVGEDTPFSRLFDGASVPAYRLLVVEFLSTFAYRPPMKDGLPVPGYDPDREISFRLGGVYREMTIGRFGVLAGLYHEPETVTRMFTEAVDTLPDATLREWWLTISVEVFGQDKTRASTIRDPLIRFMHYLIATSICPRTRSREWVTTQDLFFLYCLCTGTRCNLARALAAHFASCRKMQERSRIYGGPYITLIATALGVLTYRLHLTPIEGKVIGRPMLFPMGLVRDFGDQGGLRWVVDDVIYHPPPAPFFGPHPRPEDYDEHMEEHVEGEMPDPHQHQEHQQPPAQDPPEFDEQHPRHVYRVAQLPARVEELLQDIRREVRAQGREVRAQGRRIDRIEDILEWQVDLELARENGLPFIHPPPRRQYPPDSP